METLDLTLRTKRFKLKLPAGDVIKAELRELTGTLRDEYQSLVTPRIKLDEKGEPTGLVNMAGLAGELLSRTMFKQDGAAFEKDAINGWPSRVIDTLFVESRKLSALDNEEFEAEGND